MDDRTCTTLDHCYPRDAPPGTPCYCGQRRWGGAAMPRCSECGHAFDDNPGKGICKTCEDWLARKG